MASTINEVWAGRAESPFAGLVVDQRAGIVTVYRVAGDDAFDADVLSRRAERVTVVLIDATRNLADHQEICRSILGDTELPIDVYVVGPRRDGTGVDVLAEGDIPTAQSALDRTYGAGVVRIERGRVSLA